jgi:hypothetical protein
MEKYEGLNQDLFQAQKQSDTIAVDRSSAAADVLENVTLVIAYADGIMKENSRSGMVPES